MKKRKLFLMFFMIVFATLSGQAQIKWLSISEGLKMQEKTAKPIFLDAYTVWCGPCKMLDQQTFSDEEFAKFITENYIPVKFNAEGNSEVQFHGKLYKNPGYNETRKYKRNSVHEFTYVLGVRAYPSMIVIEPDGKISKNIMGVRSPKDLIKELRR